MKKLIAICVGLLFTGSSIAENVQDSDKLLCSANKLLLCVEDGVCFDVHPDEIDMPQFLVVDTKKKTISTTKASGRARSTVANSFQRESGRITMQGIENGRAFSIVIEEDLGFLTAAVARDGVSISVFGACTDADL